MADEFTKLFSTRSERYPEPTGADAALGVSSISSCRYSHCRRLNNRSCFHGVRPNYYMGGGSQVLEDVYPELKGQRELYDQISSDLNARGLFNSPHFLHTTMSAQGMVSKRITPLADRFLDFITSPVD
jgi:hypothetical protein